MTLSCPGHPLGACPWPVPSLSVFVLLLSLPSSSAPSFCHCPCLSFCVSVRTISTWAFWTADKKKSFRKQLTPVTITTLYFDEDKTFLNMFPFYNHNNVDKCWHILFLEWVNLKIYFAFAWFHYGIK